MCLALMCSTFEQQHAVILGVLWELVVNPNADVKISAAVLSKALVSDLRIDAKTESFIWLFWCSISICILNVYFAVNRGIPRCHISSWLLIQYFTGWKCRVEICYATSYSSSSDAGLGSKCGCQTCHYWSVWSSSPAFQGWRGSKYGDFLINTPFWLFQLVSWHCFNAFSLLWKLDASRAWRYGRHECEL